MSIKSEIAEFADIFEMGKIKGIDNYIKHIFITIRLKIKNLRNFIKYTLIKPLRFF